MASLRDLLLNGNEDVARLTEMVSTGECPTIGDAMKKLCMEKTTYRPRWRSPHIEMPPEQRVMLSTHSTTLDSMRNSLHQRFPVGEASAALVAAAAAATAVQTAALSPATNDDPPKAKQRARRLNTKFLLAKARTETERSTDSLTTFVTFASDESLDRLEDLLADQSGEMTVEELRRALSRSRMERRVLTKYAQPPPEPDYSAYLPSASTSNAIKEEPIDITEHNYIPPNEQLQQLLLPHWLTSRLDEMRQEESINPQLDPLPDTFGITHVSPSVLAGRVKEEEEEMIEGEEAPLGLVKEEEEGDSEQAGVLAGDESTSDKKEQEILNDDGEVVGVLHHWTSDADKVEKIKRLQQMLLSEKAAREEAQKASEEKVKKAGKGRRRKRKEEKVESDEETEKKKFARGSRFGGRTVPMTLFE